jgi:hypothetical protein
MEYIEEVMFMQKLNSAMNSEIVQHSNSCIIWFIYSKSNMSLNFKFHMLIKHHLCSTPTIRLFENILPVGGEVPSIARHMCDFVNLKACHINFLDSTSRKCS